MPTGKAAGRIVCPGCGNDREFVEIAEDVILTTTYQQNSDGSFTAVDSESDIGGAVRLLCGQCGRDLTQFHGYFQHMIF